MTQERGRAGGWWIGLVVLYAVEVVALMFVAYGPGVFGVVIAVGCHERSVALICESTWQTIMLWTPLGILTVTAVATTWAIVVRRFRPTAVAVSLLVTPVIVIGSAVGLVCILESGT